MIKITFFTVLLITVHATFGQRNIDSLLKVWEKESLHDTIRLNAIQIVSKEIYFYKNLDSSFYYAKQENDFAQETNNDKWVAESYRVMGMVFYYKGEYDEAIENLELSIAYFKKSDNQIGASDCLNNIGLVYTSLENTEKALEYYYKALEIKIEAGDQYGRSNVLSNIGNLYYTQMEFEKAGEFYEEALEISREINFEQGIANRNCMLGSVNMELKNFTASKNYFLEAIAISKNLQNYPILGYAYTGIATVNDYQGNSDSAAYYYELALPIQENLGDYARLEDTYRNLGVHYYENGNLTKAQEYLNKALNLAKMLNSWGALRDGYMQLYKVSKVKRNYKEALEHHELYKAYNDSTIIEENKQAVFKKEVEFEYKQKAIADSVKTAEAKKLIDANLALEKAENKRKTQQSYFLYAGIILLLVFGIFIANRLKITRDQKKIISDQKNKVDEAYIELEEKSNEILDSINYAKRIQTAILPPDKLIASYLKQSLVLYKPKDIVAGDFYWMEPTSEELFFAAADCTGHGVPGAMVSVICNNGLNRAVREKGLRDPGKILNETRSLVIAEFEKSEEEVKDGMDIALCSLQGNTLKYAGANNPLWIIRKGESEVEEIKADKQPIGKFEFAKPFTTHTIELNEGDTFYIFSDGYADQFGGEKGKKFKGANFKKLLLSIQHEPMEKQRALIDKTFDDWKGSIEQIDDVCIIGVRVS